MFIQSESSRRQAFAEDTLADTLASMEDPAIAASLGDYYDPLMDVLQRICLPRVVHGAVQLSRRQRLDDAIPFVVLPSDEPLYGGEAMYELTGRQEASLDGWLQSIPLGADPDYRDGMIETVGGRLADQHRVQEDFTAMYRSMRILGMTFRTMTTVAIPTGENPYDTRCYAVFGRPGILITYDHQLPQGARNVTLLHEAEHVRQTEYAPLYRYTNRCVEERTIRDELRARKVGAGYGTALYRYDMLCRGDEAALSNCEIESVRRQYARPVDPYAPTPQVVRTLQRYGYINS